MSIEKSLYAAPEGIDQLTPEIEIEIEDPESVTIGMDGLEIEIEPAKETPTDFNANLAEYMSEQELERIAGELLGDFNDDVSSRKDWIQAYVDGLELLGLKIEERAEPWERGHHRLALKLHQSFRQKRVIHPASPFPRLRPLFNF